MERNQLTTNLKSLESLIKKIIRQTKNELLFKFISDFNEIEISEKEAYLESYLKSCSTKDLDNYLKNKNHQDNQEISRAKDNLKTIEQYFEIKTKRDSAPCPKPQIEEMIRKIKPLEENKIKANELKILLKTNKKTENIEEQIDQLQKKIENIQEEIIKKEVEEIEKEVKEKKEKIELLEQEQNEENENKKKKKNNFFMNLINSVNNLTKSKAKSMKQ